jgi:hypothetical protein
MRIQVLAGSEKIWRVLPVAKFIGVSGHCLILALKILNESLFIDIQSIN